VALQVILRARCRNPVRKSLEPTRRIPNIHDRVLSAYPDSACRGLGWLGL